MFIMVLKPQMFEIKVDPNRCDGWDGMVSIATRYRLDSPGLEGQDFPYLSRPAPRPTEPPCTKGTSSCLEIEWQGFEVTGACLPPNLVS
jgi:hypothetical protein